MRVTQAVVFRQSCVLRQCSGTPQAMVSYRLDVVDESCEIFEGLIEGLIGVEERSLDGIFSEFGCEKVFVVESVLEVTIWLKILDLGGEVMDAGVIVVKN